MAVAFLSMSSLAALLRPHMSPTLWFRVSADKVLAWCLIPSFSNCVGFSGQLYLV